MAESLPGYDNWKTENEEEEDERESRSMRRRKRIQEIAEEKADDERQG